MVAVLGAVAAIAIGAGAAAVVSMIIGSRAATVVSIVAAGARTTVMSAITGAAMMSIIAAGSGAAMMAASVMIVVITSGLRLWFGARSRLRTGYWFWSWSRGRRLYWSRRLYWIRYRCWIRYRNWEGLVVIVSAATTDGSQGNGGCYAAYSQGGTQSGKQIRHDKTAAGTWLNLCRRP